MKNFMKTITSTVVLTLISASALASRSDWIYKLTEKDQIRDYSENGLFQFQSQGNSYLEGSDGNLRLAMGYTIMPVFSYKCELLEGKNIDKMLPKFSSKETTKGGPLLYASSTDLGGIILSGTSPMAAPQLKLHQGLNRDLPKTIVQFPETYQSNYCDTYAMVNDSWQTFEVTGEGDPDSCSADVILKKANGYAFSKLRSLNGALALSEKFLNAHNSLNQEYAPTGVMSGAIILSRFGLKDNQFDYREFGYAPTDKTRPFSHLWEIENVYRCKSLSENDTISLLGKNTVEFIKAKQPKKTEVSK